MNYSKKHIKAIVNRKYTALKNKALINFEVIPNYQSLYWMTAKHYSNRKRHFKRF